MVTMADIAREAGVSLSTVSYALSGKRAISETTRSQIIGAIDRLDYRPDARARALASRRSGTIGLAVPLNADVDAQVIMMFVRSLMVAAHETGDDVLLVTGEDRDALERVVIEGKVDALIVMDVVEGDPRIDPLASMERPVVLLGYPSDARGIPRVDFDFTRASALAAGSLHQAGARTITMIGSPSATLSRQATYADRAAQGFRDECDRLGITGSYVVHDPTTESTGQAIREILDEHRPDALIVHNEGALPGIHRALVAQRIAVPEQLQVIAIAPRSSALLGSLEFSAVEIPVAEIGRTAMAAATALIEGREAARDSLIPPQLIHRDTTRQEPG